MSVDLASMSLGERMKYYEGQEGLRQTVPGLPLLARLDGRAFHTFCEDLNKPYDARLSAIMRETTRYLVEQTHARTGYTQSDEITLVWHETDPEKKTLFDGRFQKLASILAATATAKFNQILGTMIPEKAEELPVFDCRVWTVPDMGEAANAFLWRERDAIKNSIQAAGQAAFDRSTMHGRTCSEVLDMLRRAGIDWSAYPTHQKRGVFFQRKRSEYRYTAEDLKALPARHAAHENPNLIVGRYGVVCLEMAPFQRVDNKMDFIFYGQPPLFHGQTDAAESPETFTGEG